MQVIRDRSGGRSVLLICVDHFECGDLDGRVFSPVVGTMLFHGIAQLTEALQMLFDTVKYPQATHEIRTFFDKTQTKKEGTPPMNTTEIIQSLPDESGEKATFIVQVKFRQNATWQGTIQWVESKKQQNFRSTLELIRLMDDALSQGATISYDGWQSNCSTNDAK